jgi:perosamine synthetase
MILNKKLALFGGKAEKKKPFPERYLFDYKEKKIVNKLLDYSIKTGKQIRYSGEYEKKYQKNFNEFMDFNGHSHCVNSGTNALLCCLGALDLKKNSEVIVPTITDVGCVTPVILMGLKPIPCDIDESSFNINIQQIKKKITKKTKAVIVAHIGGEVANIIEIKKFLKKKKIYLIEDCSQSHGAKINNIRVGNFGDISFFSTMASKLHCTGGTGGVVYSRNKRLIKLSRMFADRGKLLDKYGNFGGQYTNFGINCTLDEISSAIGLIQLNKLKKNIKKTHYMGEYIKKKLEIINSPSRIKNQIKNSFNVYWFLRIELNIKQISVSKKKYCEALAKEGVNLKEQYRYNPFEHKWYEKYLIRNKMKNKKLSLNNYENSLKKYYIIFIRENYSKQDLKDIFNCIKKVDYFFRKKI